MWRKELCQEVQHMRSVILLVLTTCFLCLLAGGPDRGTWRAQAQTSSCASKDCSPSLPWLDFDPACCKNDMQKPYHYYQRDGFVSRTVVHCKDVVHVCGTDFIREKDVERKIGCPKDAYWQVFPDLMVCCTAWQNAVKTGKPCDPSKSPSCSVDSNNAPSNPQRLFDDSSYQAEHKPDTIWVSGKGGFAKIYSCTSQFLDLTKVITSESNGTPLPVTKIEQFSDIYYHVKGERGSGTYEGCVKADEVACDPKKVRKE
jgi:hypothetical protein